MCAVIELGFRRKTAIAMLASISANKKSAVARSDRIEAFNEILTPHEVCTGAIDAVDESVRNAAYAFDEAATFILSAASTGEGIERLRREKSPVLGLRNGFVENVK
jgi:hypothetical protein